MLPALSLVVAREYFCGLECGDQDAMLRRIVEDGGKIHDGKFFQPIPGPSQVGTTVEPFATCEPQAVIGAYSEIPD